MFGNGNRVTKLGAIAAALSTAMLLGACGGGATASKPPSAQAPGATAAASSPKDAGTPVNVTLGETDTSHMFMKVNATKVPAGPVTFTVANLGVKTHEFVVLKTDTMASKFSIVSFEGEKDRIDEDTDGRNVGETGDMEAGSTKTLTMDLAPGHYALVCNLPGHYRMGMYTNFQVS